jgi:cytochrome c oxidase subunit 2
MGVQAGTLPQACFSRRRTSQTSPAEALMPPRSRTIGVVAALAVVTACAPESVTEQGKDVNRLYDFFTVAAAVIFTITAGLIAWSIARYRGRAGVDLPEQWHSNVPLEIFWFAVPSVIVVVLFIFSINSLDVVDEKVDDPQVTVTVEGFQWGWRFSFEGEDVVVSGTAQDPAEVMLPVGETISFEVSSADVIHSFYVPKFLFKRDAIPGRTSRFDLTIDEPGTHDGKCAEFCGLLHEDMNFTITAVERHEFDRWLDEQRGSQ